MSAKVFTYYDFRTFLPIRSLFYRFFKQKQLYGVFGGIYDLFLLQLLYSTFSVLTVFHGIIDSVFESLFFVNSSVTLKSTQFLGLPGEEKLTSIRILFEILLAQALNLDQGHESMAGTGTGACRSDLQKVLNNTTALSTTESYESNIQYSNRKRKSRIPLLKTSGLRKHEIHGNFSL